MGSHGFTPSLWRIAGQQDHMRSCQDHMQRLQRALSLAIISLQVPRPGRCVSPLVRAPAAAARRPQLPCSFLRHPRLEVPPRGLWVDARALGYQDYGLVVDPKGDALRHEAVPVYMCMCVYDCVCVWGGFQQCGCKHYSCTAVQLVKVRAHQLVASKQPPAARHVAPCTAAAPAASQRARRWLHTQRAAGSQLQPQRAACGNSTHRSSDRSPARSLRSPARGPAQRRATSTASK